jgi:hypothetical protein
MNTIMNTIMNDERTSKMNVPPTAPDTGYTALDRAASRGVLKRQRVQPFFIGKDARNLETLIDQVYAYRSNYKMQSYALWIPVATKEISA